MAVSREKHMRHHPPRKPLRTPGHFLHAQHHLKCAVVLLNFQAAGVGPHPEVGQLLERALQQNFPWNLRVSQLHLHVVVCLRHSTEDHQVE